MEDLQKTFSFLQKCLTPPEVQCNICNGIFSYVAITNLLRCEAIAKNVIAPYSSNILKIGPNYTPLSVYLHVLQTIRRQNISNAGCGSFTV
ncbi:hypothetical protein PR048_026865 [Dryococelus australis]|uniref:Uncharacterized protein n=1 Tax=Dryococelus australis TaxID=614101 RepID=A0ABQ9GMH0_9NEOP|nr:hypothetical protein PR048_026865 [Dryococelus australis]